MASVDALGSSTRKRFLGASFRHPPGASGASGGGGGGGAWTGRIKVEKVLQKSVATTVYARYPLKYLLPSKVASSRVDCTWVYAISYGGGILSKDAISQAVEVGAGCSVVMTTQSSTKIYKSGKKAGGGGKEMAQLLLKAHVAAAGFLAVLPDPITCFQSSRYVQLQEFVLALDASLLLVDWLTSGRIDSGESWDFELYRSTNHIFVEEEEEEEGEEEGEAAQASSIAEAEEAEASGGAEEEEAQASGRAEEAQEAGDGSSIAPVVTLDSGGPGSKSHLWQGHSSSNSSSSRSRRSRSKSSRPLLLDCMQLENGVGLSIAERMHGFHVIAMVVIYGPQLAELRKKMETKVEEMMMTMTKQKAFNNNQRTRTTASNAGLKKTTTNHQHHQHHHHPPSSLQNASSDGNGDGDDGVSNPSSSSSLPPSLIFASCSPIGISDEGLIVRIVASSTETVYNFLREQLATVVSLIGACPYAGR